MESGERYHTQAKGAKRPWFRVTIVGGDVERVACRGKDYTIRRTMHE